MAITPGGNVVPCQSWLSGSVLGDMRADSWESIWNGARCAQIRAHSAEMDGSCPLRRHPSVVAVGEPDASAEAGDGGISEADGEGAIA